jgi:hypothetical protein
LNRGLNPTGAAAGFSLSPGFSGSGAGSIPADGFVTPA